MIIISPSILSCDYSKMGQEFENMKRCGADWLHIDVMDGHFVPNITLGAPIVKCLRKCSELTFDVHLMISDPLKYASDFAKAGANIICFHVESESNVEKTIELIHSLGCTPALALKPATSAEVVFPYLNKIGMVLVMTVEPGFGGQSFMHDMMPKVAAVRNECDKLGLSDMNIQVDGGINAATVKEAAAAGANVFVAGSSIFSSSNPRTAIADLRSLAATQQL